MTDDVKFTYSVGNRHYMGGLQWVLPSKTNRIGDTKDFST